MQPKSIVQNIRRRGETCVVHITPAGIRIAAAYTPSGEETVAMDQAAASGRIVGVYSPDGVTASQIAGDLAAARAGAS